jgi:hypothetical protein
MSDRICWFLKFCSDNYWEDVGREREGKILKYPLSSYEIS